jgi:hypothetical protein
MVRLGCGEYCLQAGGYGGGSSAPQLTRILTTQVTALPDGTVPIAIDCLFRQPCLGALNLSEGDSAFVSACQTPAVAGSLIVWWGQSDLDVPAHQTRTLGVTLSPCALRLLSQQRGLKVVVTADSGLTAKRLSRAELQGLAFIDTEVITVLAP